MFVFLFLMLLSISLSLSFRTNKKKKNNFITILIMILITVPIVVRILVLIGMNIMTYPVSSLFYHSHVLLHLLRVVYVVIVNKFKIIFPTSTIYNSDDRAKSANVVTISPARSLTWSSLAVKLAESSCHDASMWIFICSMLRSM